MALIECPDCKKQISDHAPACPNCGRPMAESQEQGGRRAPVQTIEETGKRWKRQQIASVAMMLWGFGDIVLKAADTDETGGIGFGALLFLGGLGFFIYGQIMIWWHHK